ncbi:MAG: ankyrin repeat domain-containing protein, partial [Pseudomonas sp.]|nr:ankyrin repeat domain-containing protein [Pseudomonas sp.]
GKTALMFAAMFNQRDIFNQLLDAGANTRATDDEGKTALDLARAMGATDIVALLQPNG